MEPITMKFLRAMEQNDICNLFLKNMDNSNRKFSYNRNGDILLFCDIIIISMYSFSIINLFCSNTVAKSLNYFRNIDQFGATCSVQF